MFVYCICIFNLFHVFKCAVIRLMSPLNDEWMFDIMHIVVYVSQTRVLCGTGTRIQERLLILPRCGVHCIDIR